MRKQWSPALLILTLLASEVAVRAKAHAPNPDAKPAELRDGQHDFDFEIGSWKAHLKRLTHRFTGSDTWGEYNGTSVVTKRWNGRANIGKVDVDGPQGQIQGLALRLYNPQSHQWRLYWANRNDAFLQVPTMGQFDNHRGELFDQEDFQGRSIFVRFLFSDLATTSFRTEQAFSPDGGETWKPNWTAAFTCERK
jgi:hypothetical protein